MGEFNEYEFGMLRKLKMDDGCITNYLKMVKKIHVSKK